MTDDGVGIPPADLSRIFDPFHSTLGGTIDATSELGRRSTFRVDLPVLDGKATVPSP